MSASTFSDSLSLVENITKWKRKNVLDFLQKNKEVLDIEPSNIKIIKDNRVASLTFLGLTEQKFVNLPYSFLNRPAGAIANLVKKINDKRQKVKRPKLFIDFLSDHRRIISADESPITLIPF
ncbi:1246_t:CDS:2, partial [Funneliformis mosseae]